MNDTPASLTPPPEDYSLGLAELKDRIHDAQQRATLAVNQRSGAAITNFGNVLPKVHRSSAN